MDATTENTSAKSKRPPKVSASAATLPPEPTVDGRYEPALPLVDVVPSPARTGHIEERFASTDPEMVELTDSVNKHGVIVPVVVRPRPAGSKSTAPYELVAGERRHVASGLAGRTTIPAIVSDLTDVQVVEYQLIENLRRKVPHELDEAESYRALLEQHGRSIETLVATTGQSKATIYARMKLLDLVPEVRRALLAREIDGTRALLIARIPVAKLQVQALHDILGRADRADYEATGVSLPATVADMEKDRWNRAGEPLTARQAAIHIQRRYMLRLSLAKFPTDDATLVPAAGACATCEHRTGNQAELFGDVAGPDICTKPPCFDTKTAAAFSRVAADAEGRGVRLLKEKAAEGIFRGGSTEISHRSDYVDPKESLPYEVWSDGMKKAPTWAKALGSDLADAPRVLVKDPTGAPRELISKAAATKLLQASGKLPAAGKKASAQVSISSSHASEEAARRRKMMARRAVVALALPKIASAISTGFKGDALPGAADWWRWIAIRILETLGSDAVAAAQSVLKLEAKRASGGSSYGAPFRAIKAEIERADATPAALRYVVGVLLAGGSHAAGGAYQSGYSKTFEESAKRWKVDLRAIAADAAKSKASAAVPAKKGGRK